MTYFKDKTNNEFRGKPFLSKWGVERREESPWLTLGYNGKEPLVPLESQALLIMIMVR